MIEGEKNGADIVYKLHEYNIFCWSFVKVSYVHLLLATRLYMIVWFISECSIHS